MGPGGKRLGAAETLKLYQQAVALLDRAGFGQQRRAGNGSPPGPLAALHQ